MPGLSSKLRFLRNRAVRGVTRSALAWAVAASTFGVRARAAGEDKQAAILVRAFSYDYSLKAHAQDAQVRLAVLYKPGNGASESAADAWQRAFKPLESVKVQGLQFVVQRLPYEGPDRLKSAMGGKLDIAFVCDGLDGDLTAIRDAARDRKILTVGARQPFVEKALSLGVFADGDKNAIFINLPAATAEGVTFSSDLLRLAKVLR